MSSAPNVRLSTLLEEGEWAGLRDAFLRRETKVQALAAGSSRFASLWADWIVEAIGCFTVAPENHERFRLLKSGKTLAPSLYVDRQGVFRLDAFRQLVRGGGSLALGNFEDYFNPVLALSRELEAEFRCPAQVNLYITPPESQGLGSHVDPHDVLILQVSGEKSWTIYEGSETTDPHAKSVLRAGGWLYLPKGVRHDVRNEGTEPSIHLTVGFHPLSWGEVFERALHRARVAQVPLNGRLLVDDNTLEAPEAMLARLQAILPFVDVADHRAKYYAHFPGLAVPVPPEHVPPASTLAGISEDTQLVWRSGAILSVAKNGGPELTLPYRRAPVVFQSRFAETLSLLKARGQFTPRNMPLEAAPSLLLARFLVALGALAIE